MTEHFGELHRVTLLRNQSLYTLPLGEARPYFSFNRLAHRVTEAHISDNQVVRHTSVANKWKTIHLLLYPGHNATQIQYNITFQRDDSTEFTLTFNVAVDTREVPRTNVSQPASKDTGKELKPSPTPEEVFVFSDIPEDKRGPKIRKRQDGEPQTIIEVPSLNVSLLPAAVRNELQKLEEKLLIGDITMKGFNLTKAELLKPYKTLGEKQQVMAARTGGEGTATAQKKPYKDLDGDELEVKPLVVETAEDAAKRDPGWKEVSRRGVREKDKAATPLIPVHIDDKQKAVEESAPLNAAIERPMTAKLLGSISKVKSGESRADATGAAPVGRKLQHFTSSDRGFLPWERRKYFQDVLEVNGETLMLNV